MTNVRRACLWVLLSLTVWPLASAAQTEPAAPTPSGPPPAHLSTIEGQAFVDREGRSDTAVENLPLLEGDRLRTEDGRAEVMLPDGSLLHLDRYTRVDLLAPDLLRLLQGRVTLIVRGARDPGRAVRYQLDAPVASVQTGGPGEYRLAAVDQSGARSVELAVVRGEAALANDLGAQTVRAGERAYVQDGLAPSAPQYFNSARWNDFDRWSAARRDAYLGTVSVQYLPADLQVYSSTFDQYGTWRNDPTYGNVWYPSVAADWRPYSVGYWQSYPAWGSFWVGADPWGWPTHHYGRWGFSFSFGWYWMPASAWAPSWVYWAHGPGYVSWCALGFHDYPVFGHWGVRGHYSGGHYDPWRGWNVMERRHFASAMPVHRYGVDGHRLDQSVRGAFVAQRHDPIGYAVPRSYAGGAAVPRGAGGTATPRGPDGTGGARAGEAGNAVAAARAFGAGAGRAESAAASRGGAIALRGNRATADVSAFGGGGGASADRVGRRTFSSEAPRPGVPRTDAPAATPDIGAFRNRRDPSARSPMPFDAAGNAASENRYRARALPDSMRSVVPPASPAQPRSYDAPRGAPAPREPSGGIDPRSGGTGGYATPRRPDRQIAPQQAPTGGSSDGSATPRRPERQIAPQQAPTGGSAGGYATPRRPERQVAPQSMPSEGSRPERSAPGYGRSPQPPASSAGPAARYNPGSGAARSHSGGSSPPSRGRGGPSRR